MANFTFLLKKKIIFINIAKYENVKQTHTHTHIQISSEIKFNLNQTKEKEKY